MPKPEKAEPATPRDANNEYGKVEPEEEDGEEDDEVIGEPEIMVPDLKVIRHVKLRLQLFDRDFGEQDDFIGGADVDISTILNASDGQEIMITKTIKNIGGFSAGDLNISVCANQDGTLIVTALGAKELSNPDAVTKVAEAGGSAKLLLYACVVLLVYFIVGVAFFVQMEKVIDGDDGQKRGMRVIEAVYFAVCTFSTVGYGIPAPITDAGKLFTVFFSLCGVGLISIAVAIGMAYHVDSKNASKLHEEVIIGEDGSVRRMNDSKLAKIDPDKVKLMAELHDRQLIFLGVLKFIVTIGLGGAIFCWIERSTFVDGIYWATITAITVGYGDVVAKSDGGMVFSCFFMLFGATIMANVIGLPTEVFMGRMNRDKINQVLNAKIDRALFEEMDEDGSGDISKDEFLLYMLENLGLVEREKLRLLNTRFLELEEAGVLEKYKNDVTAENKKKDEAKKARELEAEQNGGVVKFVVPDDEERVVLHEGNEHRIDEFRGPSPTDADEMERADGRGVSQGCGPGNFTVVGFLKPC
mmetsp:Transcript_37183/g.100510  ORF Transcript_37183/g.100510 Transcript_37183/m.100510 type:complete len:527 (-) Transcript_37183:279-1859(-)